MKKGTHHQNSIRAISSWLCLLFILLSSNRSALAAQPTLGDLDGDGQITVLDVVRLVNHIMGTTPLPSDKIIFADVNQDGAVNKSDLDLIAYIVAREIPAPGLPLNQFRETSPAAGEANVSVDRETVLR